jgi:hypothetical protein
MLDAADNEALLDPDSSGRGEHTPRTYEEWIAYIEANYPELSDAETNNLARMLANRPYGGYRDPHWEGSMYEETLKFTRTLQETRDIELKQAEIQALLDLLGMPETPEEFSIWAQHISRADKGEIQRKEEIKHAKKVIEAIKYIDPSLTSIEVLDIWSDLPQYLQEDILVNTQLYLDATGFVIGYISQQAIKTIGGIVSDGPLPIVDIISMSDLLRGVIGIANTTVESRQKIVEFQNILYAKRKEKEKKKRFRTARTGKSSSKDWKAIAKELKMDEHELSDNLHSCKDYGNVPNDGSIQVDLDNGDLWYKGEHIGNLYDGC